MSGRHARSSHRGRGRHAHAAQGAAAAAADAARLQLLDAALKPPPKHTYSSDDEDDEDFAEFKQQAAQLARQAKPPPVLPDGLEPGKFATALQQLQQHLGITQEVATDALLATAEEHWRNYEGWLDEAQMFLALRQETDLEAEKMREAMEASIRERDQQQQAERSSRPELTNLSEERLRKRFAGSAVLQQLGAVVPGPVLFCDRSPLFDVTKCQLVALLLLEERCGRWWPGPGTQQYFNKFAGRCVSELQSCTATRSSCTHIAAPTDGSTAAQEHQQALQSPDQQQGPPQEQQLADPAKAAQLTPSPQQELQQEVQQQQHSDQPLAMGPPADVTVNNHMRAPSIESDSRAESGSLISAGSAATAGGERRQSTRKRQAPERYRSVSPHVPAKSRSRRTATPPPAAVTGSAAAAAAFADGSCSGEPKPKQPRLSAAHDVGSRAASEPAAAAAASTAVQQKCLTAANGAAGCVAVALAGAISPAVAVATDNGACMSKDQQLQQQLDTLYQATQQPASSSSGAGSSSLVYQAAVVQQLSKLLASECSALQSMIYSFPPVAGAVPAIFKADEAAAAAAEDDGSSSDVEITADVAVRPPPPAASAERSPAAGPAGAAAASPVAVANGLGNSAAGSSAADAAAAAAQEAAPAAAAAAGLPQSPGDSPAPRFPQYQGNFFEPGDYERSPSVEIISD